MDSRYCRILYSLDKLHYFKMTHLLILTLNLKMLIKVLAGNNQLLPQWVAIIPKFRTTENSTWGQSFLPQMCMHLGAQPGSHCSTRGTTLQKSFYPGLATGSEPLPGRTGTEILDVTPGSSFAHLIQPFTCYPYSFHLYSGWLKHFDFF